MKILKINNSEWKSSFINFDNVKNWKVALEDSRKITTMIHWSLSIIIDNESFNYIFKNIVLDLSKNCEYLLPEFVEEKILELLFGDDDFLELDIFDRTWAKIDPTQKIRSDNVLKIDSKLLRLDVRSLQESREGYFSNEKTYRRNQ